MTTPTPLNAAEDLDGVRLDGGWTVQGRIPDRPGATGGNFSIAYTARHDDGREGFCKVLNYHAAMTSHDPAAVTQAMVEAYNFERDLLRRCGMTGCPASCSRLATANSSGPDTRSARSAT